MESTKTTINPNGHEVWRLPDGTFHREDGPAITYPDGEMFWYINGKIHREDGPAVIWSNGEYWWCLHDVRYLFNGYCDMLRIQFDKLDEDIMMLRMRYDIN